MSYSVSMSKGPLQLSILATYKRIYGHLLIPFKYRVSDKDVRWPQEYYHFPLGSHVSHILKQQDKPKLNYFDEVDMNALRYIGFDVYGVKGYAAYHHLVGFQKFLEFNKSVSVPSDFVVPHTEPWPEPIWGYKLGIVEKNIRSHGDHSQIHLQLIDMGFLGDAFSEVELKNLKEAIGIFKKLNGHLRVPKKFSIKRNKADYPQHLQNVSLINLFPR